MRNFLLGCCVSLLVGASVGTFATAPAQSPSQPGNPYAPGSFMSETLLQNAIISNDADAYLNSLRQRQYGGPVLDLGPVPVYPSVGEEVMQGLREHSAAKDRAQAAIDAAERQRVERLEREVERMEWQNAIDDLRRGR